MPVLPGPMYANLEDVMNSARDLANDAYNAGAGEILTDDAPFTVGYINTSLDELQDRLENNASVTLTKDNFIVSGLNPVTTLDPSIQTNLSFTGYTGYNGSTINTGLVLPSDMMAPEVVTERQTGAGLPFVPMHQCMEGLPSRQQYEWLRDWVWQNDTLAFVGAIVPIDIRIRYRSRQPIVVANSIMPFINVTINVLGCKRALAYLIAYRYVASRGAGPDGNAPMLRQEADAAILQLIRRITRQKQGIEYRRPRYGSNKGGSMTSRLPF